ncbi:MAG: M23 family metallopeptidase [Oscillospiraceae bacterium]
MSVATLLNILSTAKGSNEKNNSMPLIIAIPVGLIILLTIVVSSVTSIVHTFLFPPQEFAQIETVIEDIRKQYNTFNTINPGIVKVFQNVVMKSTNLKEEVFDKAATSNFIILHFLKTDKIEYRNYEGKIVKKDTHRFLNIDEICKKAVSDTFKMDKDTVNQIKKDFGTNGYLKTKSAFIPPCKGIITSNYGIRNDPFLNRPTKEKHTGIDIQGEHHQPIFAIADGEIITAETNVSYGNCIQIKHVINNTEEKENIVFYSFYAHLARIDVKIGQKVIAGNVIALEGGDKSDPTPGSSTGHHLHFEMRKDKYYNDDFNPSEYILQTYCKDDFLIKDEKK